VLAEFGSNQTLRLPQPITEAAKRFCKRRLTICGNYGGINFEGWFCLGEKIGKFGNW